MSSYLELELKFEDVPTDEVFLSIQRNRVAEEKSFSEILQFLGERWKNRASDSDDLAKAFAN